MYCYNIRFWYYYLLASLRYPSSCVVRHTLCFRPTAQAAVPPAYKPFPVKSHRAQELNPWLRRISLNLAGLLRRFAARAAAPSSRFAACL